MEPAWSLSLKEASPSIQMSRANDLRTSALPAAVLESKFLGPFTTVT